MHHDAVSICCWLLPCLFYYFLTADTGSTDNELHYSITLHNLNIRTSRPTDSTQNPIIWQSALIIQNFGEEVTKFSCMHHAGRVLFALFPATYYHVNITIVIIHTKFDLKNFEHKI